MNKKYTYLIIVFLIVTSCIAYGRILGNGFVNLDDPTYVTQNNYVQKGVTLEGVRWAFTTLHAEFWHPLTWLSLMFDYQLHGLKPGGYHLTNLILHILATLLLFWFFNRATGAIWRSAFVAAIFALHPLHVESVAWIAERKDTLSAFFWMLTLCLYIYYTEKPVFKRYLLVLLCFACGLMSKSMLVTLPIVMILLDYWPLNRLQLRKDENPNLPDFIPVQSDIRQQKDRLKKGALKKKISPANVQKISETKFAGIVPLWQLSEKIPFFILSAIFTLITFYAQHRPSSKGFPLSSLISNALISYATYLGKTFWPYDLVVFYPFIEQLPVWEVFGAMLLLLLISLTVITTVKRWPYLFVGWFWYIVTLLPVIGIFNNVGTQARADRYTYLTIIGIGIMLAWGIPLLFQREEIRKKILLPAGVLVLVVLAFLTWQQCGYWKNSIVLYERALQITKNNDLAHYNLGNELKDQGNMEEALKHFLEAVKINPNAADAHNNIGIILELNFKKYDEAIYHYRRALQIDPDNPGIHFNLGIALAAKGERQEAIRHFQRAIYLKPDYEAARQWLRLTMDGEQKQTKL